MVITMVLSRKNRKRAAIGAALLTGAGLLWYLFRGDNQQPVHYAQPTPIAGPAVAGNSGPDPDLAARLITEPITMYKAPRKHLQNEMEGDNLLIYYTTNSNTLFRNDLNDITRYAQALAGLDGQVGKFIIEGYCDHRGTDSANLDLARKRIQGAAKALRRNLGYNPDIEIVVRGEEGATESSDWETMARDRMVRITPDEGSIIHAGLRALPSDVYLIDASGSMQGEKWSQVGSYQFPNNSDIYAFNTFIGLDHVNTPRDTTPDGKTPLYDSLYDLVGKVGKGKSITILSDGIDNSSHTTPARIIDLARQRGIKLNFLGVGLDTAYQDVLANMSQQTGGKFYFGQ
ncbi:MAG: hypothetical protein ABIJ08_02980 [Nanoarchaeota archaeon]